MTYLPYARQDISEEDVRAVVDALRGELITQGARVREFEERLAQQVGARYAVAMNSGTAALHAAYAAAGVGRGAAVLTSPITFAATGNAALYLGGDVVFADVDEETICLDPAAAAAIHDQRVRVLVPVHFGGQVANLEALSALARERGWVVVEDAAHALGATYATADGQEHRVGACAHSAMCCFSFHAVKHITTGEGGAVTTNDEALHRRLLRFRTHGITRDPGELVAPEGDWYYEQQELGFNYRITDFQCALGTSQLRRLGKFLTARRAVASAYHGELSGIPDVRPTAIPSWSRGAYHLFVVRVPAARRRAVFDALRAQGIGVNVHYLPVYRHPYYQAHGFADVSCPAAERYYAEAITLPMFPGLTDEDVVRVAAALREALTSG